MSKNSTIDQIPNTLHDPERAVWAEVSLRGKSYRLQFGVLSDWLQTQIEVAAQNQTPFWSTLPAYTITSNTSTISIQAGGKINKAGEIINAAAKDLIFAPLDNTANSRFDAVIFSITNNQFELIKGEESSTPTLPLYNNQTQVILTYIFIDNTGLSSQEPAQSHAQNTDIYLDFGGVNQVSAEELRILLNDFSAHNALHENYIGYKATETELPKPLSRDSFALVGEPISIWVYDVETNTWSKPAGSGGGSYQITFDDFEPASPPLIFAGPKKEFQIIKPTEITSYSFRAKLEAAASYTTLADIAALEAWITTNVTAAGTVWRLIIDVAFTSTFIGETALNLIHK